MKNTKITLAITTFVVIVFLEIFYPVVNIKVYRSVNYS